MAVSARARRPYYGWLLAVVLGFTETVSWGVLYYAFSVLIPPTTQELGWSRAEISGALSVMLVVSGVAGLVEPRAKVEIEAVASLPDGAAAAT